MTPERLAEIERGLWGSIAGMNEWPRELIAALREAWRERDEAHERADHFMAEMKLSRQRAESAKSELALLRPVVEAAKHLTASNQGTPNEYVKVSCARLERLEHAVAALARAESAEKGERE